MTERQRIQEVVYADWQKGSVFARGLLPGQGEVTDYQALNMQVYQSGALGPRPYLRRHSYVLNGTATGGGGFLTAHSRNTLVLNATGIHTAGQTHIIQPSLPSPVWTSKTGLIGSGGLITSLFTGLGGTSGFNSLGNNYFSSSVSETLTFLSRSSWDPFFDLAYTALPSPVTSSSYGTVPWKDRLFVWGDGTRVFYSDAAAFTTFTSSSQFFDVGYSRVLALYPLRDTLLIATEAGIWYALTGNTPEAWSLREIGRGRRPDAGNRAAVFNNAIWFIGNKGQGVTVVTPEGVNTTDLSFIQPWIDFPQLDNYFRASPWIPMPAVASEDRQGLILPFIQNDADLTAPAGFQAIEFVNQSPQWSGFWRSSPTAVGYGQDMPANTTAWVYGPVEMAGRMWLGVYEGQLPNNTTDCIALYSRDITLNRPSNSSDTYSAGVEELGGVYAQSGNGTNMTRGEVRLRTFSPEPGYEVRVRQVIADVQYWVGGAFTTPTISLKVDATEQIPFATTTIAHTAADSNLDTVSGLGGLIGRVVWRPEIFPFSGSVQVSFTNIVGFALRKVVVEYEIRPTTPRS